MKKSVFSKTIENIIEENQPISHSNLPLGNLSNLYQIYSNKQIQHIEEFKLKALQRRLIELGIQYNLESDSKRRFKLFSRKVEGNREDIYYNDGSVEGKRIISFEIEYLGATMSSNNLVEVGIKIHII